MSKAQHRARWMLQFETATLDIDPRHRGRIEWQTAAHLYHTGLTPSDAATQYCKNRPAGPDGYYPTMQ